MSTAIGVQVLNINQITLPSLPNQQPIPPIKLSLLDSLWTGTPIQRLFLYCNPNTTLSFPSLVEVLKSSLSAILLDYLPLSGKLTYVPSTGDVEIDLSSPGVTFVEAESDLDLRQLATNEIHDVESFTKLVPVIDFSVLPFPVFVVQVTRFGCGGIALGYSVHHTVVDGKALWQFVDAWSYTCRAKMGSSELLVKLTRPSYDRALIKHPKGEELKREILRSFSPDLPIIRLSVLPSVEKEDALLPRRTFIVDASTIQYLKQKAMQQENNNISPSQLPSTFSVLSAHVWASIARAKCFDTNEHTLFCFLMDCRAWLNPPIDDNYFGNCVRGVSAPILVGELTGKAGLSKACSVIRKSINDHLKDPLSDCENWVTDFKALPVERVVNAAASPRFQAYESDFGWGTPDRCELVSMNRDGEFVLVGGREKGTTQMSIALNLNQIETFSNFFLGGLRENT